VPACGTRDCGPDPTCGITCGTCGAGEECNSSGRCEATGPRGPNIITFNTNSLDITQGESVVFSAVVTDPDGIDDVIGGTLLDVASGLSYGSFATAAAEGAYTLTVPWSEMHRLASINFTAAITRTFRAEFFDAGGNRATRDVTLTLTCDGIAACSGVCTDLSTTENCGSCGNVCPARGFGGACNEGVCGCAGDNDGVCGGACVDFDNVRNCGGCGLVCERNQFCRWDRTCGCNDGEAYCTSVQFSSAVCRNQLVTTGCGEGCDVCALGEYCDGERCVGSPSEGTVRHTPQGLSDYPVLQVFLNGAWRNVCDDGFGAEEAVVACRSLGGQLLRYETEVFDSDFAYEVGDFTCSGTEASLASCGSSGLNNAGMRTRCGSLGNSVSVFCSFEPLECPSLAGLVINEVFMNPAGDDGASNSEFIELRGVAGTSLNGVSLVGFDAAGNEYGTWVLDGATIPSDGYFVVGPSFNTRNQDFVTGGLLQNGPASLQLRTSCGGGRTIDAVAWGTFGSAQVPRGEGSPEPVPGNDTSIGRNASNSDTASNADDFQPQLLPTPGQTNFAANAWAPLSLDGDFGGGDRTFRRPGASCGALAAAGSYVYDVYEIRNQSGSNRTVDIEATWLDVDGFLIIYSGDSFDPASPGTNCLTLNDDASELERSRSIVQDVGWTNGATLTIVLTGYDPSDFGAYTLNLRP
jgi:hypothetical protein